MQPFQLSNVQKRNLLHAQNDIDAIDREITLAQNAGMAIDSELLDICKDCRERLFRIHSTYYNRSKEGEVKKDEPISKSTTGRRIIE